MAEKANSLNPGLKTRHLMMLSIGGVIGGGLFVGSGSAINIAGPAVIISYILSGIIVLFAMMMLGEMAANNPDTGSFSTYADNAFGRWCGFFIGWLYWFFWSLLMGWEINVASVILYDWFNQIEVWHYSLILTTILVGVNCLSVTKYGELEFWLSSLKVIFIILFIIVCSLAVVRIWPYGTFRGYDNLLSRGNGGFFPNGYKSIIFGLLSIIFSFLGTEIVTVASSETKNPSGEIERTIKSIIWRIMLFYVGSIFVIVCLIPWNSKNLINPSYGPFRVALDGLGIPYSGRIVNFIILVSVLSCFNSALYVSSRMLYSLSKRKDAPSFLGITSKSSNPFFSVIFSSILSYVAIYLTATNSMNIYHSIMQSVSIIAFIIYIVIAFSQLKTRAKLIALGKDKDIKLKTWFYPWSTYIFIIIIIIFLIIMMMDKTYQKNVLFTFSICLFIIIIGIIIDIRGKNK